MNLANKITFVRVLLIPVIVILLLLTPASWVNYEAITQLGNLNVFSIGNYHLPLTYLIAGILFIVASLTDMLDGYVARKYNMVTNFGKFFDAIADKLLTNSVLIIFACFGILPIWLCIILICRDFIIDVVRQILANSAVVMAANKMGKIRATAEMVGLSILFFLGAQCWDNFNQFGWINQVILIPMYVTVVLSILSAVIYINANKKVLFDSSTEKNDEKKSK
ncbi:CDP-diacylglycerol--glycerol-3-phosphate 3-phosphatidyltransferase [Spiroplasma floricola]|uniref:CDP-diacylglycerol--glycerol-3-phosphate 3-phosphatidyltransferase n=1 Tax=Spiroplasma floricola 23-6 TaxID=1336749 RepID=A0A2K8SEW3_9MOLU|nr:CDP-diacylglycerol--glycerol-3-phosphate 3-phosphatidyltransferase [Spiroplasma floricola]AUB31981.1 CDP-diacylglycerol-glycerol-3-phosphate 3-phosphatidyltransferase [Spiroplasma floricola 23-6]